MLTEQKWPWQQVSGAAGGAFCGLCNSYNCEHTRKWLIEQRAMPTTAPQVGQTPTDTREYTGKSVSYYRVHVAKPTSEDVEPYTAECNDIIEVLRMNFAEGNAFKAIWRMCAARLGKAKQGYKDGVYDAEKVEFFGGRMVEQQKDKQ